MTSSADAGESAGRSAPVARWLSSGADVVDISLLGVSIAETGEDVDHGPQLVLRQQAAKLGIQLVRVGFNPVEVLLAFNRELHGPHPAVLDLPDAADQAFRSQSVEMVGQGGTFDAKATG